MHFTKEEIYQKLAKSPILPLFNHKDLAYTQSIIQLCYRGGMLLFEFTNRGENAKEIFQALQFFLQKECPGMALGAGTIITEAEAKAFFDLGADFIVQPIITPAVGSFCQKNNLAWIPGAMTLNEIYQATQLGAEIVKIFPGNVLGPAFVKAIKAPMPHLKLMATGGVSPTEASLREWFEAGVTAVGIGSQLLQNQTNNTSLENTIKHLLQFVETIRNDK